jgi:hypothetical protein
MASSAWGRVATVSTKGDWGLLLGALAPSFEGPAQPSNRSASVASPMRPRNCLFALPLAALAIAGCGGGGGGGSTASSASVASTPTPAALNKAEYIKEGDSICAEVNAAVGSIGSSSSIRSSSQVGQVAEIYIGMANSLKGLGLPQGGANSQLISAAEALSKAESEAKLANERTDSSALSAAETSATSALTSFQSAAQAYGFRKCSEGPRAPSASSGSTTTPSSPSSSASSPSSPSTTTPAAPSPTPESQVAPNSGGAGGAEGVPAAPAGGGGSAGGGGGTGSGGIGPG